MSVEVITLGCRLNAAESEAMRRIAPPGEDLVIVNSCAVTNEAVRQARQTIRRVKKARPEAKVFVTGCAAQVDPDRFAAMAEVHRVVGNGQKLNSQSFMPAPEDAPRILVSDIMALDANAPHLLPTFSNGSRAFLEVQNGCDHRCTFCIIPYGRGASRSVPAGAIVDQVKALVDDGYQEIVLTGVDVTSYGPDLPGAPSLGLLVERILRHVPDLPRLRLSSVDSIEIDERLEEIICGEPRFMPHLHMSFQSGDDMILKRMKRRHTRAQAVETVARLKARRPEIAVGADLIAGFPTETEEMAENSLRLIDDCDIVMAHIFPYSAKQGTPAAKMPQVDASEIKARAARLRDAGARQRRAWLQSMVGSRQRVLIERSGTNGHSENFAPVRLATPCPRGNGIGRIMDVKIKGMEDDMLIGEAA